MTVHELKVQRGYFAQLMENRKTAEIRKDDGRNYKIGDELLLKCWDAEKQLFSGASIRKKIVGKTELSGLIPRIEPGWVVLYLGEP